MVSKKSGWVVTLGVAVSLAATGCVSNEKAESTSSVTPKQEATSTTTPETKKEGYTQIHAVYRKWLTRADTRRYGKSVRIGKS